jgi:GNAT superfamily N-acetyltransferase
MALGYVRTAHPEEAGEIARIQLETWRVAYRRILPARVLDRLDSTWMVRQWRSAIEAPPTGRHRVLVAFEQAERQHLVGFAASGPAGGEMAAPGEGAPAADTAAITDLLVAPRWGRRGHGSRLLAATVELWRGDGFVTALAWAFEADHATRGFLASAGWEPDGASRSLDVDDLLVPQIRLHTSLIDAGASDG